MGAVTTPMGGGKPELRYRFFNLHEMVCWIPSNSAPTINYKNKLWYQPTLYFTSAKNQYNMVFQYPFMYGDVTKKSNSTINGYSYLDDIMFLPAGVDGLGAGLYFCVNYNGGPNLPDFILSVSYSIYSVSYTTGSQTTLTNMCSISLYDVNVKYIDYAKPIA